MHPCALIRSPFLPEECDPLVRFKACIIYFTVTLAKIRITHRRRGPRPL